VRLAAERMAAAGEQPGDGAGRPPSGRVPHNEEAN
jgi:hypothetical protein